MSLPVLADFAAQRATIHEVLRAIASFDGWLVPQALAHHVEPGRARFDVALVYSPQAARPPERVWVFTSQAAADAAAARTPGALGPYRGFVEGAPLFANLPPQIVELAIDPGAPDGGFTLDAAQLPMLRAWGGCVAFERGLDRDGPDPAALVAYEHYILLMTPDNRPVVALGAEGMVNPALVFTAADAAALAIAELGPRAAQVRQVVFPGVFLFGKFPESGVDGLLLNPMGPAATLALTPLICAKLAALAR